MSSEFEVEISKNKIKDKNFWENLLLKFWEKNWNNGQEYLSKFGIKQKESEIPKIRKKIFEDQEFVILSEKIIQHSNQKKKQIINNRKKIFHFRDFFTKYENYFYYETGILKDFFYLILYKNYEEFNYYLDQIFEFYKNTYKFTASSILINDFYSNYYCLVYSYGFDLETKKNFFVNINDLFFYGDEDKLHEITIHSNIKHDFFLTKRFSNEFLEKVEKIFFYPIKSQNYSFMFIFFFQNQQIEEIKFSKNIIESFIRKLYYEIHFLLIRESHYFYNYGDKNLKRYIFSLGYQIIERKKKESETLFFKKLRFKKPILDYESFNSFILDLKKEISRNKNLVLIRTRYTELVLITQGTAENLKIIDNIIKKIKLSGEFPFTEEQDLITNRDEFSLLSL